MNEKRQVWQTCQACQPTVLVYTTFALEGWSIAEKLAIPSAVISLFPLDLYPIPDTFEQTIRQAMPTLYHQSLVKIWSPHIHHWMWRLFLEDQGDFRDQVLNIDPIPCINRIPALFYALDPALFQTDYFPVCGYWSLTLKEQVSIKTDRPLLVVHFGSMDTFAPCLCDDPAIFVKRTMRQLYRILDTFDLDIVWLVSDHTPLHQALIPYADTRIHILQPMSHRAMIDQLDVIGMIHHGGIGTCSTLMQLCLPQAMLPFLFDQPYWADRLSELGIGLRLDLDRDWTEAVEWMLNKQHATYTTCSRLNDVIEHVYHLSQ
ncbi:hypothetical protein CU098_007616 [Rhizopus stolonifer]|uniref:Uncharacterized protein n=1 Tax=Rhizopus stolonifer TaxID=4846 RepID=A0A367J038_RHIST|nr:hypothetical protein CU098_007616 [Rhizopus stolonifer]